MKAGDYRGSESAKSLRNQCHQFHDLLCLKLLALRGDVGLQLFDLTPQFTLFDLFERGVEGSLETFEPCRHESRRHDSSSSNRNLRPPVRVSIVSSCAARPAIPC